jgi:succinate dehydrogenase / fumarate reductase cytochrome b subunit
MSKSALLSSSIAKKYWMAITGLFLCLFLVGHLLGNLQLILNTGEEGRRAFNEYAYFMSHNIVIKGMSYATYLSILFHAIDGIMLAVQNKKARPVAYAYNKPGANSSSASRNMAVLGSAIFIFIAIHMSNFWWKMKYSSDPMPLHLMTKDISVSMGQNPLTGQEMKNTITVTYALTTNGDYIEYSYIDPQSKKKMDIVDVKDHVKFYAKDKDVEIGEGYKDLHSLTVAFFGQDRSKEGVPANKNAGLAVALYVLAMLVLSFHLWHGFASAFQSLGMNHPRYTPAIRAFGKVFSIVVPLLFAIIPILLFINK